MLPIQLIAICSLFGLSFARDTCSISLPSSDERSCDYVASQQGNYKTSRTDEAPESDDQFLRRSESRFSLGGDDDVISWDKYQRALKDALDKKFESSIPIIRKAVKKWSTDNSHNDLCADLLDYGHTRGVRDAALLYDEAEENCKMALVLNPHHSLAGGNLEAIRSSREVRGLNVKSTEKIAAEKPEVGSESEKTSSGATLADSLRIYPGPSDDGNLEFKLYNGSSVDPHLVTLHLGEVYVEDDFISEDERRVLVEIIDRGLPYKDKSGYKGPIGAVLAGPMSTMGSQLSKEERILVATVRKRVVNRANDLRGLDTSMYSYVNGVRAHSTALLRYIESGKHKVHHDNDFLNRCLSSSIVLNDDFEGGDFNLHTTKNQEEWNLKGFPIIGSVKGKAGRLSLFLSQSMHSVSELVSGTRDVFFLWLTCDADAEYQLDDPLEPVDDRKAWVATA